MKYETSALSLEELADLLVSKGLIVGDKQLLIKHLSFFGYFKFRGYFGGFINVENNSYTFKNGVLFEDILEIIKFDHFLRCTVFEAIVHIEIALKAAMNNVMTMEYGTHWYLKKEVFKKEFTENYDEDGYSSYDKFIKDFESKCQKESTTRDESSIRRYQSYYTEPTMPPSWMMLDILPFGKISILYQNLLKTDCRQEIANLFGTHNNLLETWLKSISNLRNICAHHMRVVYRKVTAQPKMPKKSDNIFLNNPDTVDTTKLYSVLCCMQFLLIEIGVDNYFKEYLKEGFENFPNIKIAELGFPPNWLTEKIWQENQLIEPAL